MSLLEIHNLSKSFKGLLANDKICMELKLGEARCIIGPNGAGKTTLISMISGHLFQSSGIITFDGENISNHDLVKRVRLGIGRKFQTPTLFDNLTVYENVELSVIRNNYSNFEKNAKIDETLKLIRLFDEKDVLANTLSHGQRQWLEIGLLIGNNVKLLLLDEPTAGMTTEETIATTKLINNLSGEKNLSIIVIEHDINFVRELGAQITVLHLGKIFAEGNYSTIENNKFVREIYLGAPDVVS